MAALCDICGFQNPGNPNFCGGCGVDLREPRASGPEPVSQKVPVTPKKDRHSLKNKESNSSTDENTIHWCVIKATCDFQTMTFPRFLFLAMSLARGKTNLGFCGCTSCEQDYRELLAEFTNYEEKKKLKPNSREIVKKSREHDFFKISFYIAEMIGATERRNPDQNTKGPSQLLEQRGGKITLDIDKTLLEGVILDVLKSEAGQNIIRDISSKSRRSKSKKPSS